MKRYSVLFGAVVCFCFAAAGQPATTQPVARQVAGTVKDKALMAWAPAKGFIDNDKDLRALMEAWSVTGFSADFASEIVLVATADGPNRVRIAAKLDEAGNLSVLAMSTRMAGPGFGYALMGYPRAGVRSVNGHPLPERPASQPTTQPATQPASQPSSRPADAPSDLAMARWRLLKENVNSFTLTVAYEGPRQDKPYESLMITTILALYEMAPNWSVVTITEQQALRLIDHLAASGYLDQARHIAPKADEVTPPPAAPTYTLNVSAGGHRFSGSLGWGGEALRKLKSLHAATEGDAADALKLIIDRLQAEAGS